MQLEEGKTYEKIYVIGHKNPDTDSICSAIAYADFKKRTGHKRYIPCRAGIVNEVRTGPLRDRGSPVYRNGAAGDRRYRSESRKRP